MSSKQISPVLKAWYNWKALRLPWRKRFLVGLDLHGNTYWEFRETALSSGSTARWRRIVQYPRSVHYGDVRISPQWHQWLRHARDSPPSLDEQRADVLRRQRTLLLAAEADARWEAKERLVGGGSSGEPVRAANVLDAPEISADVREEEAVAEARRPGSPSQPAPRGAAEEEARRGMEGARGQRRGEEQHTSTPAADDDPWKRHRGGPSEEWQPEAWNPTSSKR